MGRIIKPYKRKKGSSKQKKELQELNDLKNILTKAYYSQIEDKKVNFTEKNTKK